MVVVAQLVRALDCGSRGRRFETGLPPNKKPSRNRGFCCYTVMENLKSNSKTNISNHHSFTTNTRNFWNGLCGFQFHTI